MPPVLVNMFQRVITLGAQPITYLVPIIKSKKDWIRMFPPIARSICLKISSSTMPRIPPLIFMLSKYAFEPLNF